MEYSNNQAPGDPIFWRLCDEVNCHCDFRMTITHCLEHRGLFIVNVVDIVWSAIATAVAGVIMYDRVYKKKLSMFDHSSRIPRPKPIESMVFFGLFFNFFRVLNASILISDIGRNAILRAILFEIPWQCGMTALSCYFFGVCHTLANSSKHLYSSWVGSQRNIDIICFIVIALPILTINVKLCHPVSIVAGYYAQIGDIDNATTWTEAIYYLWGGYDFLVGSLILGSGLRLLRLLKGHLKTQGNSRENIAKIKLGATKVKIIIVIGCVCLWGYCVIILLYASSRHTIMLDSAYSITITSIALFNGPLATSIIEFAILLNIRILNGLGNLSLGSLEEVQSETAYHSKQKNSKLGTSDEESTTFHMNSADHQLSSLPSPLPSPATNNKLQSDVLWSRSDTLACLKEQQDQVIMAHQDDPFDKSDSSTYQLQLYHRRQNNHSNDDADSSIHYHLNDTSIEEEKQYYNDITNQYRVHS
ncbi:unnamed protein product [Cunninghamella blakesleeana]